MKYRSEKASIENVKRFFSNTPSDFVSIQDAFIAWGRDLEKVEENMGWLSNKLTSLKYNGLITPIYDYKSGHRKLEKLQLTLKGKKALGRIEGEADSDHEDLPISNGSISLADLTRLVVEFKKKNTEHFEITFDVRLKSG